MLNGACGVLYAIAFAGGPSLGGLITVEISWRWLFWIAALSGLPVIVLSYFYIHQNDLEKPDPKNEQTWSQKLRDFDWIGLAILSATVTVLLLVLQWGGSRFRWSSASAIILLLLATTLSILFVCVQLYRGKHALLPLQVARQRTVAASALYAFALSSASEIVIYYIPLWFQAIKGVSAIRSGVFAMPLTATDALAGLVTGFAVAFVGYVTPFMLFASASAVTGGALLATMKVRTGPGTWASALVLTGIGNGAGYEQSQISVQTVLKDADLSLGIGFVLFAQTLGPSIALGIAENIFLHDLRRGIALHLPSYEVTDSVLEGATEFRNTLTGKQLKIMIRLYNHALTRVFYIVIAMAAVSFVASCFIELRSVKDEEKPVNEAEVTEGDKIESSL